MNARARWRNGAGEEPATHVSDHLGPLHLHVVSVRERIQKFRNLPGIPLSDAAMDELPAKCWSRDALPRADALNDDAPPELQRSGERYRDGLGCLRLAGPPPADSSAHNTRDLRLPFRLALFRAMQPSRPLRGARRATALKRSGRHMWRSNARDAIPLLDLHRSTLQRSLVGLVGPGPLSLPTPVHAYCQRGSVQPPPRFPSGSLWSKPAPARRLPPLRQRRRSAWQFATLSRKARPRPSQSGVRHRSDDR